MNPEVLKKMRFNPTGHNAIYADHLETITDTLEEICPLEAKECISITGAAVGISDRFIKEHFRRLEACKIIKREKGMYLWLLNGKKQMNHNEEIIDSAINGKSEFFQEELKPCKYRPREGDCNPVPGKIVKVNAQNCNACTMRDE